MLAETSTILLLLGGVAIIVIVVMIVQQRSERLRAEALAQIASVSGFEYDREATGVLEMDFVRFALFGRGRRRAAKHLLRSRDGEMAELVFDYRYVTGGGQHSRSHSQTVAAFQLRGAALPVFSLRPEYLSDKIAGAIGFQDIDFPLHPDFSKRYLLRGTDEHAVRDVFTDARIESVALYDKICIEGGGDWLIVYRTNRRIRPDVFSEFLDEARNVRTIFAPRRG